MSDRLEQFLEKDAQWDKDVAGMLRLMREDLRELRERVARHEERINRIENSFNRSPEWS